MAELLSQDFILRQIVKVYLFDSLLWTCDLYRKVKKSRRLKIWRWLKDWAKKWFVLITSSINLQSISMLCFQENPVASCPKATPPAKIPKLKTLKGKSAVHPKSPSPSPSVRPITFWLKPVNQTWLNHVFCSRFLLYHFLADCTVCACADEIVREYRYTRMNQGCGEDESNIPCVNHISRSESEWVSEW
jgi:hypothetical protein